MAEMFLRKTLMLLNHCAVFFKMSIVLSIMLLPTDLFCHGIYLRLLKNMT